jgi:hypothetical protein
MSIYTKGVKGKGIFLKRIEETFKNHLLWKNIKIIYKYNHEYWKKN